MCLEYFSCCHSWLICLLHPNFIGHGVVLVICVCSDCMPYHLDVCCFFIVLHLAILVILSVLVSLKLIILLNDILSVCYNLSCKKVYHHYVSMCSLPTSHFVSTKYFVWSTSGKGEKKTVLEKINSLEDIINSFGDYVMCFYFFLCW